MKIFLTGGRGFIGRPLRKELVLNGHELFLLTRTKKEGNESLHYIQWSKHDPPDLSELMNQIDVVINLAGEHLSNKRWTKEQKELIRSSRVDITRLVVDGINNATKKPKKLISASAVGIYGNRHNEKLTEASSLGKSFLASVCKEWESETQKAQTNVAILRLGVVLGKGGGALEKMMPPFKMYIGGHLGSGKQWMSWVHLKDVIGLIKFAIENDNVAGILNATSPNPVTNKEFSDTLGKVLHRPSFIPIPGLALRLLFGKIANEVLLSGQKVYPQRALEYGYKFKHTELEKALKDVMWSIAKNYPD